MRYWLRMGDSDTYNSFDNLEGVVNRLVEVVTPSFEILWTVEGFRVPGVFKGDNYVSLYVGDKVADKIRDLTKTERGEIEFLVHRAGLRRRGVIRVAEIIMNGKKTITTEYGRKTVMGVANLIGGMKDFE